jgi:hypothetical protein
MLICFLLLCRLACLSISFLSFVFRFSKICVSPSSRLCRFSYSHLCLSHLCSYILTPSCLAFQRPFKKNFIFISFVGLHVAFVLRQEFCLLLAFLLRKPIIQNKTPKMPPITQLGFQLSCCLFFLFFFFLFC